MKRTEPEKISAIIDQALSEFGLTTKFGEQRACNLWPEVVGPGIDRYTTRRYVEAGVMHVYITSAPLKNELQFMRAELVRQLNNAVGEEAIKTIVIH